MLVIDSGNALTGRDKSFSVSLSSVGGAREVVVAAERMRRAAWKMVMTMMGRRRPEGWESERYKEQEQEKQKNKEISRKRRKDELERERERG